MNDTFWARIERALGSWSQHEGAAWTGETGFQWENEPGFSQKCLVERHLRRPGDSAKDEVDLAMSQDFWWRWTVRVRSDGVSFRARGHTKSMEAGKTACKRAVRTITLGIVAQYKGEHP